MLNRPNIKIMTYNVMLLFRGLGDYDQEQRSKSIGSILLTIPKHKQADIIIFTEMFSKQASNIIDALKADYPYYTYRLGKVCSGNQWDEFTGNCSNSVFMVNGGVVIMSKYPITYKVQYIFKNRAFCTPDYFSKKGAAYVKINKQGYIYHIIGTHMQADHGENIYSSVRNKQLEEIRNFIEYLDIPKNEPVIVGGDFNIPYAEDVKDEKINKLLNGVYKYTFEPNYGSFSAISNNYAKCLAEYMNYPLDYDHTLDYIVYLNDYLQPVNDALLRIVTLKTLTRLYWKYMRKKLPETEGYYSDPSDHYPVETEYFYS